MKKLIFLISFLTIAFDVKIYPQYPDSKNTYTDPAYKYAKAGWRETDHNPDIYNIWNHPDLPFTYVSDNLFIENAKEVQPDHHLKALESGYPGDGGCVDNRMILDSIILYYSHQPAVEGLKVQSSVYDYDARLNKIEEINYTRDWTIGSMQKEHRYVYAYDANGNQTEWASYFWDSQTKEWIGFWRNVYIYGTKGNLAVLLTYDWDLRTSSWINCWPKVDYTYDANGRLSEKIICEWDSEINERIENERYSYKYNTRGNLIADTCYRWDASNNSWRKEYFFAYLYDSRSRLTGKCCINWDSKANKWIHYLRNVYTYDGSSNPTSEIIYDYNSITNSWRGRYCYDYKYDGSENLVEEV
jgi:hypothetical protein